MTEHKSVHAALVAAQAEFGTVPKGSTNPAFKSRYADLADVVSVVVPVLSRHGVAVLHYFTADGAAMRTEFHHAASGTRVWCDVPLIVDRQNMQGMKSATTYAKRIGLESLSGVAPEDDDGNAAAKAPPPARQERPEPPRDDTAQIDALRAIADAADLPALQSVWQSLPREVAAMPAVVGAKDTRKLALTVDDEIPL